jgi:glycyl-tRNA synthetase
MTEKNELMDKVISLAKRRGFIYQGSEIYGGLAGFWDYGPRGVELRHNIKQYFWEKFIKERTDVYPISAAIIMPERVWEASGHLESFTDPLVECKVCHVRVRADQDDAIAEHEEMHSKKKEKAEWTEPRVFNLMMKTELGSVENQKSVAYLRGEITQGVHVNFKNIIDSMHPKMPFGVGQIGKAFRNEITPGNFIFRDREFEQMELQYYVKPSEADKMFEYWKNFALDWYKGLGIKEDNLRLRQHADDEKAHYAKDAWDIEYNTSFGGWKEAWGIHNRGDWDLRRHSEYSQLDLSYKDEETGEKFIPYDIECSGGVDRAMLYVLLDAYHEDELGGEKRVVLKLAKHLAPVKAAVFPLLKNKPELVEKAREIFKMLKKEIGEVEWDDNGNIGKRYRRQDEIGTPYCVTIDFDTLGETEVLKDTVTLRDRDTGEQRRVHINDLVEEIGK